MKKRWIEFHPTWTHGPMTFWVHRHAGLDAKGTLLLDPPAPKPVPGKGWPSYFVEFDGFVFQFASLIELDACAAVLGQKLMPTTKQLSAQFGSGAGPNSHWLSRLPKNTKSWRYRQRAVTYLLSAKEEFLKDAETQSRRN